MAHATTSPTTVALGEATVADYIALLKPRVMSLVIFTALVGMTLAPTGLHPVLGAISLLAIAVGAGASAALNMWWDADIDAVMSRTRERPVPAGRVAPEAALAFGITLSIGSVVTLGLVANWLAAGLLAFTIWFYGHFYTMILKRRTAQNIVIGGAAGALPPVIGWAAMTGSISLPPLVLFAIIFLWTPPHFWALALLKNEDYARAGVPMLPVVAGPQATRWQILLYAVVLVPVGLAPAFLGFAGPVYAAVAAVSGGLFVLGAVNVLRHREGKAARRACGQLFGFSILYLFLLFATLLAEHLVQSV
ncbi:heme o synthase [Amorphus orientalis]|uniref:Protoheme IX farnesyltransferase n=1 Tax=Amorphus orientalis TaxID=649198 RepID=A0AAE3VRL9_9HYPH|nr:heme o synthase [Amorphus orientalis]MDQ0316713.1 protoheme IX farnesyltransferase [Amorphus orientalis]